jgi:hypothetical protein
MNWFWQINISFDEIYSLTADQSIELKSGLVIAIFFDSRNDCEKPKWTLTSLYLLSLNSIVEFV